jgi:hypothetical protein
MEGWFYVEDLHAPGVLFFHDHLRPPLSANNSKKHSLRVHVSTGRRCCRSYPTRGAR